MDLDAKYVPAMEFLKASLKIHETLPSIFYALSINPFFSLLSPYKSQNIITLVLNLLSAHYDDYVMTLNGVCINLKQCCYICHNSLDTDRRSNMCKPM